MEYFGKKNCSQLTTGIEKIEQQAERTPFLNSRLFVFAGRTLRARLLQWKAQEENDLLY